MLQRSGIPGASPGTVPRVSGDAPQEQEADHRVRFRSPRERGCSAQRSLAHLGHRPFPARAGMLRGRAGSSSRASTVPRASGDAPFVSRTRTLQRFRSPRERGCSEHGRGPQGVRHPFPARAGMLRAPTTGSRRSRTVPRASGDAPPENIAIVSDVTRSPRERGCSVRPTVRDTSIDPFPARAGMLRCPATPRLPPSAVPRASGDAPRGQFVDYEGTRRSPRERGCSVGALNAVAEPSPFPARAGMLRFRARSRTGPLTVPRASGDAPPVTTISWAPTIRSPARAGLLALCAFPVFVPSCTVP